MTDAFGNSSWQARRRKVSGVAQDRGWPTQTNTTIVADRERGLELSDTVEQTLRAAEKSSPWLLVVSLAALAVGWVVPESAPIMLAISSGAQTLQYNAEVIALLRRGREWVETRLQHVAPNAKPTNTFDLIFADQDEVIAPARVWETPAPSPSFAF